MDTDEGVMDGSCEEKGRSRVRVSVVLRRSLARTTALTRFRQVAIAFADTVFPASSPSVSICVHRCLVLGFAAACLFITGCGGSKAPESDAPLTVDSAT